MWTLLTRNTVYGYRNWLKMQGEQDNPATVSISFQGLRERAGEG